MATLKLHAPDAEYAGMHAGELRAILEEHTTLDEPGATEAVAKLAAGTPVLVHTGGGEAGRAAELALYNALIGYGIVITTRPLP